MSNDNNRIPPDWSSVHLSEDFTWTDAISSNGRAYKIGTSKDSTTVSTADQTLGAKGGDARATALTNKAPFDTKVNWTGKPPPERPGVVFDTPTAEETATTSITKYALLTAWLHYNEFHFCCTEPYSFYFYDKTGDYYGCNVFWARPSTTHSVAYFSSDPTIVRVTGK